MSKISISLLGVDSNDKYNKILDLKPDYLHLDIMDNIFVNNYKNDYKLYLDKSNIYPLDIHLMVNNPIEYIDQYINYNPTFITIHYEINNLEESIKYIKQNNIKVGIAINPETNIENIYPFLTYIDLVLIMSVNPGYGGQEYIRNSLNKISTLKKYIDKNNLDVLISCDGGINDKNYAEIINNGVDILVVGSYITNSNEYINNYKKIREC